MLQKVYAKLKKLLNCRILFIYIDTFTSRDIMLKFHEFWPKIQFKFLLPKNSPIFFLISYYQCSAQGQVLHSKCRNLGCSSAEGDLPPQTQEPRLQFYPLLSMSHSLFSIWTDIKRSEKIPGASMWVWREWIWLTGPPWLHRNLQILPLSCIFILEIA